MLLPTDYSATGQRHKNAIKIHLNLTLSAAFLFLVRIALIWYLGRFLATLQMLFQ